MKDNNFVQKFKVTLVFKHKKICVFAKNGKELICDKVIYDMITSKIVVKLKNSRKRPLLYKILAL